MGLLRFQKSERLTSKKTMDLLFKKGSSKMVFPLRVIHLPHPGESPKTHQVLITVSSRNFRKATDRNTIKRRIREGYRLNKSLAPPPPAMCVAYIYIAKEILPSTVIHEAVRSSLEKLKRTHEKAP